MKLKRKSLHDSERKIMIWNSGKHYQHYCTSGANWIYDKCACLIFYQFHSRIRRYNISILEQYKAVEWDNQFFSRSLVPLCHHFGDIFVSFWYRLATFSFSYHHWNHHLIPLLVLLMQLVPTSGTTGTTKVLLVYLLVFRYYFYIFYWILLIDIATIGTTF